MDPVEFAALRVGVLNRIGEFAVARAVVQDIDTANWSPALTAEALTAYLGSGDITGACPAVRLQGSARDDGEWQLMQAICNAYAGESALAATQLDRALFRGAAPRVDVLLARRFAGAAGRGQRGGAWLSPPGAGVYVPVGGPSARRLAGLAGLSLVAGSASNVAFAGVAFSPRVANVTLLQRQLKAARDRARVGEYTRTDVAQANTEVREARLARNQLVAKVEAANFLVTRRAASPTMLELLDELTRRIPDHTSVDKLTVDDGRLVMVGQSRAAPALVGLLQASPILEEPALTGAVQADPRTGRDRFTLTARVVGNAPEVADDSVR